MKKFFPHAEKELWIICIKYKGNTYLTLYDGWDSDSLLHDSSHILYFSSMKDLGRFCEKNELESDKDIWGEYNFDVPFENPIDYRCVLDGWNLLNTVAKDLGMFFEGNRKKYNALYDLLFRLNTPVDPIPPTYFMKEKDYRSVLKIFRKKDRFLNRFVLYQDE